MTNYESYAWPPAPYRVHTNGPSSNNSFEYAFGTDEYGQPTDLRSDLVITDTDTGHRHCLDVTFTDPLAKVNMAGANPSTAAGLERLYKARVQRYADICAHHLIQPRGGCVCTPHARSTHADDELCRPSARTRRTLSVGQQLESAASSRLEKR